MAGINHYDEWVDFKIMNAMDSGSIGFKNIVRKHGKFYRYPNKDSEVQLGELENMTINPRQSGHVATCGRDKALLGAEGSLDVLDGGSLVCKLNWKLPHGSENPSYHISNRNSQYGVADITRGRRASEDEEITPDRGPLGERVIEVYRRS